MLNIGVYPEERDGARRVFELNKNFEEVARGNANRAMTNSLLKHAESGGVLTGTQAEALMEEILLGRMETPDIVRLLTALNQRRVEAKELASFARVMRRHAALVFAEGDPPLTNLVDTCGTGGDGSGTFNISTAAAIVAAGAGARVAKHGNRAMSSRSGSADVLESLGVRLDVPLEHAGRAIREVGIGFLFAPAAHSATRHAAAARKQMGVRTIFNLLGPLTNPARAGAQVLGVYSAEVLDVVAEALAELGVERALVVHGAGGLDEISLAGETQVAEVKSGEVWRYTLTPEEFGATRAPMDALRGGTPEENAAIIRGILGGEQGSRRDIVMINAAAALVAAGVARDFREGAELAAMALHSGAAEAKLAALAVHHAKR
jgi:anthranilate phosphoribosyltransferase